MQRPYHSVEDEGERTEGQNDTGGDCTYGEHKGLLVVGHSLCLSDGDIGVDLVDARLQRGR